MASREARTSHEPTITAGMTSVSLEALEQRLLLAGDITITINPLSTNDTTPALSGTVDDALAEITIRVDGVNYDAANNGDGTWSLADDTIAPALTEGLYDVLGLATNDGAGTFGVDDTVNELEIDLTTPTVTVDALLTNDTTPALSGTVD